MIIRMVTLALVLAVLSTLILGVGFGIIAGLFGGEIEEGIRQLSQLIGSL